MEESAKYGDRSVMYDESILSRNLEPSFRFSAWIVLFS